MPNLNVHDLLCIVLQIVSECIITSLVSCYVRSCWEVTNNSLFYFIFLSNVAVIKDGHKKLDTKCCVILYSLFVFDL